jgi:flagellar biosynthesis protein
MKKAAAVTYHEDLPAPVLVAKGKGAVAEKLIEIARANNITITEQAELTDRLIDLDIGELIPEKFYSIMAEILAFVYKTENRLKNH